MTSNEMTDGQWLMNDVYTDYGGLGGGARVWYEISYLNLHRGSEENGKVVSAIVFHLWTSIWHQNSHKLNMSTTHFVTTVAHTYNFQDSLLMIQTALYQLKLVWGP
jgi:hypothetical protein